MPEWIDGHCHLTDPGLDPKRDQQLETARALGITAWVQGGIEPEDWDRQVALKAKLGASLILTFGLHPWWVARHTPDEVAAALVTLKNRLGEAAGLGELGLDTAPRHCLPGTLPLQIEAFERQLELAKAADKPLVLHIVRAHGEALAILKRLGPFPAGGLVHRFSGSAEMAREYAQLGLYLSIGGDVLSEGFQNLKKAVGSVPSDRLILETDAPDKEPKALVAIAEAVARIREEAPEALLDRSTEHIKRLFRL